MKSSLKLFYLYENELINSIRSEYENGPKSETNTQAWMRTRELREQLVQELDNE